MGFWGIRILNILPSFPRFKRLSLEMKDCFSKFVKENPITVSDIHFTNMLAWDHLRKYELSQMNGNIIIMVIVGGKREFVCPIGKNKITETITECLEYLKQEGHEPVMRLVSEELKNQIDNPELEIKEDEENADYIYKIADLVNLQGKQYSTKRNDISTVLKNYHGQYRLLMAGQVKYCKNFEKTWYRRRMREEPSMVNLENEHKACFYVLDNYSRLDVFGGVLFLNGVIRGFTIADFMSDNMVIAHFEKGDRNIRGTYAVLWWGLAQYIKKNYPDIEFINREQDLGMESLKDAKQKMHPFTKVRKYTIRLP